MHHYKSGKFYISSCNCDCCVYIARDTSKGVGFSDLFETQIIFIVVYETRNRQYKSKYRMIISWLN